MPRTDRAGLNPGWLGVRTGASHRAGQVNLTGDAMYDEPQSIIADYLLRYRGVPLTILEAKSEADSAADGMQQASRYARRLSLRFSIASNGNDWTLTVPFCGSRAAHSERRTWHVGTELVPASVRPASIEVEPAVDHKEAFRICVAVKPDAREEADLCSFANAQTQVPAARGRTRAPPAERHVAAAISIPCFRHARQPSLSRGMPSTRMEAMTLASVASPAPIVSTIGAASSVAGAAAWSPERVNTPAPSFPRVRSTISTPRSNRDSASPSSSRP